MKSIVIEVKSEDIDVKPNINGVPSFTWNIKIPILPAFSVEYFTIQAGGVNAITMADIEEDKIILPTMHMLYPDWKSIHIVLHYHGIRDYSLLFPWIENQGLRTRIGEFYEEADKNFEQGAWLSFALMCGAVFEGMLHARLDPNSTYSQFNNLINNAFSSRLIDERERNIVRKVKDARNLVHSGNFNYPYVTRKDAMDIMATLNELIKKFSI
ncbi:hypothetical protein ACS78_08145 [Priestia megaterium]|jgi:hypothetical protein|uniref:DUF4145 domain-containing protein n=1 Tax=Priestia megaterium TaxID=1404 RepID=UPI0006A4D4DB|nr:DUF4145 domain-containing protein [Priestia megaterium]KNH23914.1 hypothetical protein ACS78_08145 [Priestia megaterium]